MTPAGQGATLERSGECLMVTLPNRHGVELTLETSLAAGVERGKLHIAPSPMVALVNPDPPVTAMCGAPLPPSHEYEGQTGLCSRCEEAVRS